MNYQKLLVWQKADDLAYQIYLVSKNFPREEKFGITSQLRRSALSVPVNIVEGVWRQNKNETKQFANIAMGSLVETEYLLSFCKRLNLIAEKDFNQLIALKSDVGALLWRFYKSFTY